MPVHEEIRGGAVDQLETALGDSFPVIRRYALADDAAGHRDELIIDVCNAKLVDLRANLLDEFGATVGLHIGFECCQRCLPGRAQDMVPSRTETGPRLNQFSFRDQTSGLPYRRKEAQTM